MSGFQLVDPKWVDDLLTGSELPGSWKLLEAHFSSIDHPLDSTQPNTRHIPGAIQAHPSYLEAGTDQSKYYPFYDCPDDGNLLPDRELIAALRRLGITPDTLVVVYGTEPDGTMAAARLAWGLMYAGVAEVRLLDGGIDAWVDHGGATESLIAKAWETSLEDERGIGSTTSWSMRHEFLAVTEDVRKISQNPNNTTHKLVDVRKYGEWDGTMPDYYTFFSEAGHIPSAYFQGDWDNLLDMASHKMAPKLASVARRWKDQGIIDPAVEEGRSTLIFYCGTGWRSSISFLVAHLLGLRAKNYDGGFYRWSWNDENEVAVESAPSTTIITG